MAFGVELAPWPGESMNHCSSYPVAAAAAWKNLYIAALFESDRSKIAGRMVAAQLEIATQIRKLFISGDAQERQALDHALQSLQSLRTCLSIPLPATPRAHDWHPDK